MLIGCNYVKEQCFGSRSPVNEPCETQEITLMAHDFFSLPGHHNEAP